MGLPIPKGLSEVFKNVLAKHPPEIVRAVQAWKETPSLTELPLKHITKATLLEVLGRS